MTLNELSAISCQLLYGIRCTMYDEPKTLVLVIPSEVSSFEALTEEDGDDIRRTVMTKEFVIPTKVGIQ